MTSSREGDAGVLDAVASRSADGRSIYVKAVNTDLEHPLTVHLSVRGRQASSRAQVERVMADALADVNGFATPDGVRSTSESISAGNSFSLELPAHSVAVVTLAIVR